MALPTIFPANSFHPSSVHTSDATIDFNAGSFFILPDGDLNITITITAQAGPNVIDGTPVGRFLVGVNLSEDDVAIRVNAGIVVGTIDDSPVYKLKKRSQVALVSRPDNGASLHSWVR